MQEDERPLATVILAEGIRAAREAAGMTQDQLAQAVSYARSAIAMVETAQRNATSDLVQRCDDALNADGRLMRLWRLASRETLPNWVAEYFEAERQATSIRSFQPVLFPGLTQTPDYARAVLSAGRVRPPDDIEDRVSTRLERQQILTSDPIQSYWLVLDEGVLRRVIGDEAIMRKQLSHVLELLANPRVKIQVLPFSGGAYPAVGPITIHDIDGRGLQVHLDGPVRGRTTSDPPLVQDCITRFDLLRAQACSLNESASMIERRLAEL